MSLDAKHPKYVQNIEIWETMRDLFEGEERVKDAGEKYLPATASMHLDGMAPDQVGFKKYEAYKRRALFYDFVSDGVEMLTGLMHHKQPNIELPEKLEYLREDCTAYEESLIALLRRVNVEQLVTGRVGLLADINMEAKEPKPKIALYTTENIINWDDSQSESHAELNMVVLDESKEVRSGFDWDMSVEYRVLQLGDFEENEERGFYKFGVFEGSDSFDETQMIEAEYMGQKLDKVPFVFINVNDVLPEPDKAPLKGLGNISLAIYRGEADYRQTLFLQGDETLVIKGGMVDENGEDANVRVGAGSRINVSEEGDAKYIGISSSGLAEQRQALENDKKIAEIKSGNLINHHSNNQESGKALTTRISAQTASLNQIARTGAAGLERILKKIAVWMNADPEQVKVSPNLDFADITLTGQELSRFQMAKAQGLPISYKSLHALMVERGITKLTFEDEMAEIENEKPGFTSGQTFDDNEQFDE